MFLDRLLSLWRFLPVIRLTQRQKPDSTRTVGDLLEERAATQPDRIFLHFEDRRVTYADFNAAANRVAHWALAQGLRRGDRVALMMHNRPEYLFAWAGLAKLGVVIPLVNTNLKADPLRNVLQAADTTWLIAGTECVANLATLGDDRPVSEICVWGEGEAPVDLSLPGSRDVGPELRAMPETNPDRGVRDGLLAGHDLFYIYTSGTTGFPKPARYSHMRFFTAGDVIPAVAKYGPNDVIFCVLPLYHGAGGVVIPSCALSLGCAMALTRKFSASRFWDDCRRHGVTGFQYVGEICQFLLNQPERPDDRDHRVRVMVGTGLRADLWEAFVRRFGVAHVVESYGSTEGNTAIINLDNKVGSLGRIPFKFLHNGRLIRYDADTDTHPRNFEGFCVECRPGEVGEFVGRILQSSTGSRKFEGYLSREDSERKILRNVFREGDEWYRTGDLMREDRDGYFYFVDRIGDTYRWRSENVSTQEVAAVLNGFPAVEIANVYGVEVPGEPGRAGMAALVLREGASFDGAAFFAFTESRLPGYAAPVYVRLCAQADLTGSYKLRKVDLQREGYDPSRVRDPLYLRDENARAYRPLAR